MNKFCGVCGNILVNEYCDYCRVLRPENNQIQKEEDFRNFEDVLIEQISIIRKDVRFISNCVLLFAIITVIILVIGVFGALASASVSSL